MQAPAILPRLRPLAAPALFAEDFDAKPTPGPSVELPAPEPEVIAPTFTFADLDTARADGIAEGLAQAHREVDVADRIAGQVARAQLSQALAAAEAEAARIAEASAAALAELLLGAVAAALPALCAQHGPVEMAAIAADLLPALAEEPHIAISLASGAAVSIRHVIAGLAPALQQRIALDENDTMAPGDIVIRWRQGQAVRNTAALLDAIDRALRSCLAVPPTHAEQDDAR